MQTLDEVGSLLLYLVSRWMNDEAKQSRHKMFLRLPGPVLGVHHQEHVREARAEESSVKLMVSGRLWSVDVSTLGTVEFHHLLPGLVVETDGKDVLLLTEDPGTGAEVSGLIFLNHLAGSSGGQDVSDI